MLLPQMVQVLKYVYLSGIHPLAYDTQELQRENIRVVISLLEEPTAPQFVKDLVREIPFVKHQYHTIRDHPYEPIRNIFFGTTKTIFNAVDNERNVLIHCRDGVSVCVTILIAYLLRCTYKNWHKYILPVDDEDEFGITENRIPKTHFTWTETFLSYIQSRYQDCNPNPGFLQQLFDYEQSLIAETKIFLF